MEEKNALAIIAIVLVLSIAAAIFFQKAKDMVTKPREFPEQTVEYCESHGAKYMGFSSSCVDACTAQRNKSVACEPMLRTGCDCGPDMCWNGLACEKN
jgi:hypothetical protein